MDVHEETRQLVKSDLKRISNWAASLTIHFPHIQARFTLLHVKRRVHRLSDNHRSNYQDFLVELDELLVHCDRFELGTTSRLRWAERILALSCKI